MNKSRFGFTMIEVALFLAVTGLLFIGIAVGVQNSIFQQRFNDSTQNYADFLRNVYAGVMNVQEKVPGGRGERAVYGKLVTFGEQYDLTNCPVNGNSETKAGCKNENAKNMIFVYDVVGNIGEVDTGNVLRSLSELKADVVTTKTDINGQTEIERNGLISSYSPRWAARIERTECPDSGSCLFTGSLLIVRHPRSGTIYTLKSDEVINVNQLYSNKTSDILNGKLDDSFGLGQVDFCVNPNETTSGMRADVRIVNNARNSSGVEIIADDNNPCVRK